MKKILPLAVLLVLLIACASEKTMRPERTDRHSNLSVRLVYTLDTVQIGSVGPWYLTAASSERMDDSGSRLPHQVRVFQRDSLLILTGSPNSEPVTGTYLRMTPGNHEAEITLYQVPYGIGWWWAGQEDRRYQGILDIYPQATGKPLTVLELPLEEYLLGVVPYEIGPDAPLEALKAQAVAARSEAVMALKSGLYRGPHYDLTSDVECQVFSGNQRRSAASDRAVVETAGLVLKEGKRVIHAYYASNCGGHSETISNVWPDRPVAASYLNGQTDAENPLRQNFGTNSAAREWINSRPQVYCNPEYTEGLPAWSAKNFRWQRTYTADSLTAMMSKNEGKLLVLHVVARGVSGRATKVELVFENGYRQVAGELAIRQLFQPPLRSSCFIVTKKGNKFTFDGAGWGHGVGMCQSGAVGRALNGQDFKAILKHYYSAAEVKPLSY